MIAHLNKDRAVSALETLPVISLSIPGVPQTKLRPRFARHKGHVRTYDKQVDEKNTMKWKLKARMPGPPLLGPLSVNLVFVMPRPKSRPHDIYHAVKPDLDNLIKFTLDVANGILYADDKQIVSVSAVKIYGSEPRTVITVRGTDELEVLGREAGRD